MHNYNANPLILSTFHSYVTRIRRWDLVSRIGYVSDTDTRAHSYFREYWIRELIRIFLADTPSPQQEGRCLILCPRRSQSHARASCRIPVPRSVTLHRRSPATGHRRRGSASAWTHIKASRRPRRALRARTLQSRTDASRPGARRHEHHRPMR